MTKRIFTSNVTHRVQIDDVFTKTLSKKAFSPLSTQAGHD